LKTLFAWYSQGKLHPHVSNIVSLEDAADGLALLRQRASTGKVVITP
jgi:NADPH2:quinone reductase